MTRQEVIQKVVKRTRIATADVEEIVKNLFDVIKDEVGAGNRIDFRTFGNFVPRKRKAKVGRDIARNTSIHIPERIEPSFMPSKKFFTIKQ